MQNNQNRRFTVVVIRKPNYYRSRIVRAGSVRPKQTRAISLVVQTAQLDRADDQQLQDAATAAAHDSTARRNVRISRRAAANVTGRPLGRLTGAHR